MKKAMVMHVKDLSKYIPQKFIDNLLNKGVRYLYPTQEVAIRNGLFKGKNIVLGAPTASGKTLVAILAAVTHLLNGGKVLYLTPLRALASEKYNEFKEYLSPLGYRVIVSTGDYDSSDPWLGEYDVIISTNEKADSLLRHKAPWLPYITLLIADEIHIINSEKRGATLEILLTKFMQICKNVQLLALSATIRNLNELASWLNATPVKVDWRPVILREGVYYNGEIYFNDGTIKELDGSKNSMVALTKDILEENGQILIFSPTRRSSVYTANKLSLIVKNYLSSEDFRRLREISSIIRREEGDKVTRRLAECLESGLAFHHAGLSARSRTLIEEAFRENIIKVIVATPTLAAGVNLPARRVIISDYRRYNVELGFYEKISVMEYKQMAGRAGRPQYDDYGEAILIAKSIDEMEMLFEEYIKAPPERIISRLGSEPLVRTHILAIIAGDFANSSEELTSLLSKTLFAKQFSPYQILSVARKSLEMLLENEMIIRNNDVFYATELGKRVSELYIDPQTAITIIKALKVSKQRFSALGYLHMISSTPDMPTLYLRRREKERIEGILSERIKELILEPPDDYFELEYYLAQLKTALLLEDWINEVPEEVIVEKYDVGPGDIYSIIQTAEWIAYAASEIARLKGVFNHAKNLIILRERIKHGVREELLDLVKIKGIGRVRARALFTHGIKNLDDLIKTDITKISKIPGIGLNLAKKIKEAVESGVYEIQLSDIEQEEIQSTIDAYF